MKSQTTYKLLTSAVIAALLVAGCQKDDREKVTAPADQPTAGRLSFDISENGGWSSSTTKAGEPAVKGSTYRSESLLMDCDDPNSPLGDVYIYMVEEDIPAEEPQQEVATRAAEGAEQGSGGLTYGVFAYQGSYDPAKETVPVVYNPAATGVAPFQEIQNLQINAEGAYDGAEIYAPGAGFWLQFISYAPYMTVSETDGPNPALYKGTNYPYIKYTATPELAETTDLLFGGRLSDDKSFSPICGDLNTDNEGVTPPIELSFSHILSKIKVKTTFAIETTVTSVRIIDVQNKGTYTYLQNEGKWAYGWVLDNAKATYAIYAEQSSDEVNMELATQVNADVINVIPQTLGPDAKIEIVVEAVSPNPMDSNATRKQTYVLTKKLSEISTQWLPNKQYTYNIVTPEEVQVLVSDNLTRNSLNQPKKENLSILNNGLSPAYIRASIVGNWVLPNDTQDYADDYIVASWDPEGEGTYEWGAHNKNQEPSTTATTGWRKHSDGYYYHLNPIMPGSTTAKLFDSYTLTAKAPVANAVLDMTIIVQAIYPSDVTIVWPEAITSLLLQTSFVSE